MDGFYSARAAIKAALHGLICHRHAHTGQEAVLEGDGRGFGAVRESRQNHNAEDREGKP